jgi:hypothetical protein
VGNDDAAGPLVTVVRTYACHLCEDATAALDELAGRYPLRVRLVDAATPEGTALVRRHRAAMFPLVLIDGQFFSAGRLPRRKLCRLLDGRAAVSLR